MIHFCGLWATAVIPSCLVLGPRVIRAGAIIALSVGELDKGSGWWQGFWIGWFAYERHAFNKLFVISRNSPAGEGLSPRLARPLKCQNTIKYRKFKT